MFGYVFGERWLETQAIFSYKYKFYAIVKEDTTIKQEHQLNGEINEKSHFFNFN